jgi:1,4-dihydroxy-2-naphthoate octaprenyltransferase
MISHWILAARIQTLPVSLCPVILGLSLSLTSSHYSPLRAVMIIGCVILIQLGTNFANDYVDFIKGADTSDRVGPTRMTQSGAIQPKTMKWASIMAFTGAFTLGIPLIINGGWPILVIGLLAIFFGVIYTAGPYALAYIGGAEIITYLFFGPISVWGTYYLQTGVWNHSLGVIGSGIGLITAAILVVNNTRDMASDAKVNKKTWAVRFGRAFSTIEYIILLYAPIFILDVITPDNTIQMILVLFLVGVAMILTRRFIRAKNQQFNRLLGLTSIYLVLYTSMAVYLLT